MRSGRGQSCPLRALALALSLGLLAACASREPRPPPEPVVLVPPESSLPGEVWGQLRVLHAEPGRDDLGAAIVYLEGAGAERDVDPAPARLVFGGRGDIAPGLLAARVGQPVEVEFRGGVLHQPFAFAEDGERVDPVSERELVFGKPGLFRVYCSLHGSERSVVYAASSPLLSAVDEDGRYAIESVPAGTYRLVLWSEAVAGPIRSIEVESGDRLEAPIWIDARRVPR